MCEHNNSDAPRSLLWLLLPFWLGLLGSLFLHYKLKKDEIKFKDINLVNWVFGSLVSLSVMISIPIFGFYSYTYLDCLVWMEELTPLI